MTNAELIKLAKQITDLPAAQTLVRDVVLTIVDPGRHDSLMRSVDRIADDVLALGLEMRRLCREPYDVVSASGIRDPSSVDYCGHTFLAPRTHASKCLRCGGAWTEISMNTNRCDAVS